MGKRIWQINEQLYYFDPDFKLADQLELADNLTISSRVLKDYEGNWWLNTKNKGIICLTKQSKLNKHIRPPNVPNVTHLGMDEKKRLFYMNTLSLNPAKEDVITFIENNKRYTLSIDNQPFSLTNFIFLENHLFVPNYSSQNFSFAFISKNNIKHHKKIKITTKKIPYTINPITKKATALFLLEMKIGVLLPKREEL